jgi:hypothetical protein
MKKLSDSHGSFFTGSLLIPGVEEENCQRNSFPLCLWERGKGEGGARPSNHEAKQVSNYTPNPFGHAVLRNFVSVRGAKLSTRVHFLPVEFDSFLPFPLP